MQGGLSFAIVDEVDSILIDEARTPLIISGASEDSSELYKRINRMIPSLKPDTEGEEGHFTIDEKQRQVELTESGHEFIEDLMVSEGLLEEGDSLYGATNLNLLHHVYSGLRAHCLFQRDVEYIVQDGQVVLIDEHTGRTMAGRRLSEGLHQAIEAKEGVSIQSESQTLASTTFQNYFRIYGKLAGMTGTADTEAFEFRQIYGLEVLVIPTNVTQQRKDLNDLVYLSARKSLTPSWRTSRSVWTAAPRCWWVPPRWKPRRHCPSVFASPRSSTRCSTPSTTSRKRRLSPRPGAPVWSLSPPIWPGAVPISCWAATWRRS